MAQVLFHVAGVNFILSQKLCQDPVESFFGKQRAAGGHSDNPTVKDFCKNTVSLRLQGSAALLSVEIVKDNRITTLWMMLHYQRDLEK